MSPKFAFVHASVLVLLLLVLCMQFQCNECGPLPKVDEQQYQMSKVPQWHCLRYFKHDVIMMRRCRHLRVPTMPRIDLERRKK